MSEYDCYSSCNRCSGKNDIVDTDTINGQTAECKTTCQKCAFKDYWSYGHFESQINGYNKSEKYYNPPKEVKNED